MEEIKTNPFFEGVDYDHIRYTVISRRQTQIKLVMNNEMSLLFDLLHDLIVLGL